MPDQARLTPAQQQRVEDNMGLVGKVIADRVYAPNKLGLFTRDDLFQVGCMGLCKAAAKFKEGGKGQFSTYAYRTIYNEICDAMRYSTLRSGREIATEQAALEEHPTGEVGSMDPIGDVFAILDKATAEASEPIRNGAKAMAMRADGFSAAEISESLAAPQAKIRMWISRARKYLADVPELGALAAAMDG